MWSASGLGPGVAFAALISATSPRIVAAQQPAAGSVRGEVLDTTGSPLKGARVRVPDIGATALSDARGEFALTRVPPGRHELVASMIGMIPVGDTVVVRSGETTWVKLVLRQPPVRVETLPPRFARGTRPDTAPAGTETIDLVARVARLPRLRPQPANPWLRELRIWVGGGLGIPMNLLRITNDGTRVRGEEILWLRAWIPDTSADPAWRALIDTLPSWMRHDFQCGPLSADTIRFAELPPDKPGLLVAACRVKFAREPDWKDVLDDLERHHIWSLPDAAELPHVVTRRAGEEIVGVDGVGVTVETWNGARYRAYTIGNPDQQPFPEYRDAAAILHLVISFRTIHSSISRK